MIASSTNANPVSQAKLGLSSEQKRTRPGKEFSYKIVVSQLLLVEYLNHLTLTSAGFFLCRKIAKPSPLLCFASSL